MESWELKGRSMFDGIIIKISSDNEGKLTGVIQALNNNKYVKMFAQKGDLWISNIDRVSNS